MTGRPPVRGPAGSLSTSDHYRDAEPPSHEAVTAVLAEAIRALDAERVPHVLMGGLVVARYARPRATDDVDIFVKPEHAHPALDALEAAGFVVEESDPMWLFKAHRDGVLVDVIFRSSGEIYLDDEMLARGVRDEVRGCPALLISPEDLLVIKAVATAEHGPHHWYDALAIIARTPVDWLYLVERARQAGPRRVLSLLLYAESNDLAVPAEAVDQLHAIVHPRPAELRPEGAVPAGSASASSPAGDGGGAQPHGDRELRPEGAVPAGSASASSPAGDGGGAQPHGDRELRPEGAAP